MSDLITDSFNFLISSGTELYELAEDMELEELEEKIPEYLNAIQQCFEQIDKSKLTFNDVEYLKVIISLHDKITNLIRMKKEVVSSELKQLRTGKQMQNTYPQISYQ